MHSVRHTGGVVTGLVHSTLYELVRAGACQTGRGRLPSADENLKAFEDLQFSREQTNHSDRAQLDVPRLVAKSRELGISVLVDLADCFTAKSHRKYKGMVGYGEVSLAESFAREVAREPQNEHGDLIYLVSTYGERSKDSRRILDDDSAFWSYLGDPAVVVQAFAPGEPAFDISVSRIEGGQSLLHAQLRGDGINGNYAAELLILLKRALAVLADPPSNSVNDVLWSNFFVVHDAFDLLAEGVRMGLFNGKFDIWLGSSADEVEFRVYRHADGGIHTEAGVKNHGFVQLFVEAVDILMMPRKFNVGEWEQRNLLKWALWSKQFGAFGSSFVRAMIYWSFCDSVKGLQSQEDKRRNLLTSRVLNELTGSHQLDEMPDLPLNGRAITEVTDMFSAERSFSWLGEEIVVEELSEAEDDWFDNDGPGALATEKVSTCTAVAGIRVGPAHGSALKIGVDRLRFRLGFKLIRLHVSDGQLWSSVAFTMSDLLGPVRRLAAIELFAGRVEWAQRDEANGLLVSNAMLNMCLSGGAGRRVSMWTMARVLSGDIHLDADAQHSCYTAGATLVPGSNYKVFSSLDAKVLQALHTYTDGHAVYVDPFNNGDVWKIEKALGTRFCDMEKTQLRSNILLKECGIRETLRARGSLHRQA